MRTSRRGCTEPLVVVDGPLVTSDALRAQALFDNIYYPVMDETARRPCAAFVHGNSDTTGAIRAIESIAKGIGWKRARDLVQVMGEPSGEDLDACWELGAMVAARLTV